MPYFSFSLKQNFFDKIKNVTPQLKKIKINKVYFSKNTTIWKQLNKNKYQKNLNFLKFEPRLKARLTGKKILFCLPPSIGLGDSVEYALAIKAIQSAKIFTSISVAFVGRYGMVFKKYFDLENIFEDIISESDLNKHDVIYHFSLELINLKYQKYFRTDIESSIINKFKVSKIRLKNNSFKKPLKKITIFPISNSPIRSMSVNLLNNIIANFGNEISLNIVLQKNSEISDYIEKNLINGCFKKIHPLSLSNLCQIIEEIEFGIFIDSGPLHVAKILNKKGILLTTSVSKEVLLKDFYTIEAIRNNYISQYCSAPCGLTNIFNYNNNVGCYQTLELANKDFYKKLNLNSLQRGKIKDKYINFMIKPVGCIKNLDYSYLEKKIWENLK